ncbi:MAG: flagellar export chaperone FliS [Candidatus Marinimicrobia bacterium]|nr:flagellar export chaperone FliS [Candidatus Neomarinimicrobiota bacterium]MCF7880546.1 flagellar export chaperone FliS [Candidatus Neomarinimicrobiota bacterium]
MYRQYASHYKRQEIQTASPGKIIVLLYDGAIKNLNAAEAAYEAKDYERKSSAITKTQDIIVELMNALNFEQGGEIAERLQSLYTYVMRRLLDADIKKDLKAIDETRNILSELRESFAAIVKNQDGMQAKTG